MRESLEKCVCSVLKRCSGIANRLQLFLSVLPRLAAPQVLLGILATSG
ncbi:hypothetical protein GJV44_00518 [Candidatus Vallotia cooleyia]|nr:hypothetical protein GJV44_00518 [Candidatus Vallotia cooleyia]